ncbi:MAG: hypothetical protein A3B91_01015 [Candidatus Yanofskybacteria bacterium RIFCSPHIGHO2_02_FULL_41_29]|uniref:SIS domain-containing protein n=1 Tax=Candidatus Yanofskybacteria bacterium RIFCSPHIGHO2_01_FULL_41_53 TaxID=1802663 RepID=A0A1F8EIX9_9BACT|nr:MAG: hypothetical protein A2650_02930 [Candidatus Yanofskybacteria bacterium RIFCSPHIGHO2_01_FULL_41_53]OGN12735.1 MAG: hypothetical protein A3B91_01015 [Candidatus Yanofskybacteria bacterium RIFCSPHIGHO2_02_FULL_41_29]OGN16679.1 MAG: hypothetical protein A3F48_03290 [Candidatus Yanofskybacteria bacterium RIFCSPHIGHO2_12_FULL_41_9]OGN21822.1 MAG: hypothetical protein A2916_00980 [Candidatus Yanofskybacteria bacterium RIFCSPLOWO2_01_FULL_41_67]OGN30402.1 MAG: hypothetical protein A3H54_00005 
MRNLLVEALAVRSGIYGRLLNDVNFFQSFWTASEILVNAVCKDKKILIFGNGGSAAEAQHFAAELVCKFEKKRRALPAIALTTDSSILTAQSNDFGFDSVFSRQIEALCKPGDVVIGLTTSDVYPGGHSRNILNAFSVARANGAKTIGLFSTRTNDLLSYVDAAILVPSESMALVQEVHLAIIHMLCGEVEKSL